jgi:histone H3/H4
MSGRGKGNVGLGKGGARRHRKVLRDNINGITKPAIRRLARRAGVKRLSGLIYEETRGALKVFLENVIRDTVTYTEHCRRKTVTALDVVSALKKQGRTIYGFDDPPTRWVHPSFDIHTLRNLTPQELAAVEQLQDALEQETLTVLKVPRNTSSSIPVKPGDLDRIGLGRSQAALDAGGAKFYANDEVVNAYFSVLRKLDPGNAYLDGFIYETIEDQKYTRPHQRMAAITSSASAAAAADSDSSVEELGTKAAAPMSYEDSLKKAVKNALKKYNNIDTYQRIFLPVNVAQYHWVLVAICPKTRVIEFYDSLSHNAHRDRIVGKVNDLAVAILRKRNHANVPDQWTRLNKSPNIQSDLVTCGFYTCMMAHAIGMSRGKADLMKLQGNALNYRRKVAAALMTHGQFVG